MTRYSFAVFYFIRSVSGMFWHNYQSDKGEPKRFWPGSLVLHAKNAKEKESDQRVRRPMSPHRASFRENAIISYENRLRQYSHPLKIFRYFATIKMKNKSGRWDIYMTPKDFLRSQVPGVQQPEQLGLDKFRVLDEQGVSKWTSDIKPNSMFFKLEEKGLLTFSDYILLIILLAIPQRHIEIGFKLFDHDGDGILSINDMENVLMAITHGEASVMNAQLKHTLFGPQLNKDLSIQQFLGFLEKLNDEVITLEYEMLLKNSRTTITERDFANVVVGYKQNPKERSMALRRVKEKFGGHKQGITLSEYKDFFRLVKDVDAMDAALSFHYLAGAGISSESLRITARVVAGVRLTDHMVDVIFTIFDADGNGVLQRGEFLQLLRCRRKRAHAINFPLTSALNILCKCVYSTVPFGAPRRACSKI